MAPRPHRKALGLPMGMAVPGLGGQQWCMVDIVDAHTPCQDTLERELPYSPCPAKP